MKKRYKNIVTILFLLAMTGPFILITQLYPFFRMGMFAEPVENPKQKEIFRLVLQGNNQQQPLPPDSLGLTHSHLNYLLRNHYYREEHSKVLSAVKNKFHFPEFRTINLYRIRFHPDQPPDSTLISQETL